ncbi:MAG: family 20 glycosylhydrolase, partial [Bacteroidota bacterium]
MFKKLLILLVVITACDTDNSIVESNLNIIPKVNSADFKNDKFDLQSNIIFSVENDDQKELVKTFQDEFNKHLNCSVGANGDVRFETKSVLKNEAYNLLIDESGVLIQASSNPGFYYGLQSLRQLISVDILSKKDREQKTVISLPYVKISDSPRFKWRGMMLDVSRHFYTVDEVKSIIDILAMLKINTLHWHLVDDQGWRIEINKYPKLTEIGAWRVNQESLHWNKRKENSLGEKAEYGGYYTQQEIKDVVEYASSKYISIVPEIEGVAHVMSA